MDEAMAPPPKRRKLFDFMRAHPSSETVESSASFSHNVETLSYTSVPARIDEVHLHIQQRAVAQGTAVSTTSSAVSSAASTDTTSSSASSGTSSGGTGTGSISSTSSPASAESSAASTDSSASSAVTSSATSSGTSSVVSSGTGPATSTASTGTGTTASSRTGSSVATSTPPSTGTSTNASSSSTGTQTSIITSSQTVSTDTSSTSSNLTTSTFTSHGSSTATLTTTFAANLTTTSQHTTSTDPAFFFFATLANGTVATLSKSNNEITTTLDDGEVFTIPAISATTTTTSSRASSASSLSSDDTATPTSAVTSIALITTEVEQDGTAVPTTITSMKTIDPQGAAGQEPTSTYSSTSPASTGLTASGNTNDNTPPAGTIAGGVVGGAAGLAIVLLIAMLFVRWYRRRSQMGHQALPPNSFMSPDPSAASVTTSSEPGMAERAGMRPIAAAVPSLFRHQDRSISDSEPSTSERGFTKVAGRKLPSQFSPGMGGAPPDMPLTNPDRNFSSGSFYRDSGGFYNDEGESPPMQDYNQQPPQHQQSGGEMPTVLQGPQRRPTIRHAGGPYAMSPSSSEHYSSPPGTAATFGDSITSLDPRGSRFNEEL